MADKRGGLLSVPQMYQWGLPASIKCFAQFCNCFTKPSPRFAVSTARLETIFVKTLNHLLHS